MKMLVKPRFLNFQQKSTIEDLQLSCLINEMPFPFTLIACPICIAIINFMLQLVQKFYVLPGQATTDLIHMVTSAKKAR